MNLAIDANFPPSSSPVGLPYLLSGLWIALLSVIRRLANEVGRITRKGMEGLCSTSTVSTRLLLGQIRPAPSSAVTPRGLWVGALVSSPSTAPPGRVSPCTEPAALTLVEKPAVDTPLPGWLRR